MKKKTDFHIEENLVIIQKTEEDEILRKIKWIQKSNKWDFDELMAALDELEINR